MGAARLAIYLVGLLVVVAAVWVFLTQTDVGRAVPTGIALALILLLVGIGVMASARSLNESRSVRRVVHEGPPVGSYDTHYGTEDRIVEERRFD